MVNKCCMVVSNDSMDQAVFTKALTDVSPETICLSVPNAVDALFVISTERVIPDFVFIEMDSPQMDAIKFLDAIKSTGQLKEINVIVHATSPKPHQILQIKESGALAIYLRPYDYYDLCNMLNLYFNPEATFFQQN